MKRRRPGLAVVVGVALLAWGAIVLMRPIPERKAGEVFTGVVPARWERVDTLAEGETMTEALARAGLDADEARALLDAAAGFDPRRARSGMPITSAGTADSVVSEVVLRLNAEKRLRLTRDDTAWTATEEFVTWQTDTVVARGAVQSNLYQALDPEAQALLGPASNQLVWSVAEVFEYRLDMSRDLQPGDHFAVLFERQLSEEGVRRPGPVLAVEYRMAADRRIVAVRHTASGDSSARYFDQDGKSMRAAFLRAPVEFRRISSRFGMRFHPILRVRRPHTGIDYSASSGTPVRAVGDGVVVRAGRAGGYGNTIEIRHANGFVTRYAHLRAFGSGVRVGSRVSIGSTIGFVGMTGLATAPHLHFEVIVNGAQRNPGTAFSNEGGAPLEASERPRFDSVRVQRLALLEARAPAPATIVP